MGITVKNNKQVTKNMTIKGDDGVGIKTITSGTPVITEEKTTTPITVTLTDETTQNFNVEAQNGSGGDNVLTKPTTTPSATQLVAVDNTNTQTMLNIGDGLSVENGSLKASGGNLYHKETQINVTDDNLSGLSFINIDYYSSNRLAPMSLSALVTDITGTALNKKTIRGSLSFNISDQSQSLYIPLYYKCDDSAHLLTIYFSRINNETEQTAYSPFTSYIVKDSDFQITKTKVQKV